MQGQKGKHKGVVPDSYNSNFTSISLECIKQQALSASARSYKHSSFQSLDRHYKER